MKVIIYCEDVGGNCLQMVVLWRMIHAEVGSFIYDVATIVIMGGLIPNIFIAAIQTLWCWMRCIW